MEHPDGPFDLVLILAGYAGMAAAAMWLVGIL
jgi:hypothetical protein